MNNNAKDFIEEYEDRTGSSVSKGTQDKIYKICSMINKSKYKYLQKILKQYDRYRILISFLLISDKLKIGKKFKTENGKCYFNLSYEYFHKYYKNSKATYSRNINLFVVLGLIGKENPFNKAYYTNRQLSEAESKGLQYEDEYMNIYGKRLERKVNYQVENLYYNVDYTAKLLKEADSIAKELLDKKFSIGAMSSIYIDRLLGDEKTAQVYYGKNYRTETSYSIFLSDKIKETILKQVDRKGYATKISVYCEIEKKGVLFCYKKTSTERELKNEKTSYWQTFDREFKRTLGVFLQENTDLDYGFPIKKIKEKYNIKNNNFIIYNKKN